MKKKYLLTLLLLATTVIKAQEIKFEKDKVLVDKIAQYDFVRKNFGDEFTLYKLNSKDEIIYMSRDNNSTKNYLDDDFVRFTFSESGVIIKSRRLKDITWKSIIKLLIENKVIDFEGNIDELNLEKFSAKYDDLDS